MQHNVLIVLTLLICVSPAIGADAPTEPPPSVPATAVTPPADGAAKERVAALIAQLADDDFRVRDRASAELGALAEEGQAEMKAALKRNNLEPSARSALEGILAKSAARKLTGPTLVTVAPPGATALEAIEAALTRGSLKLMPASAEALRKKPDDRRTASPGKPEPMWDAVLRLARDAGMTVESVSPTGEVSLVPADASVDNVFASGPFLLGISRIETTIRRGRDLPGIRPINVNNNEFAAPPCRLYLFAHAEPRVSTPSWIVESTEITTDDGNELKPLSTGTTGTVNGKYETQLPLRGDITTSKALAKVQIKARMLRQTATEHIELGDLFNIKDHTRPLAGGRVVVNQFVKLTDDQYEYKVTIHRDGMSPADWRSLQALMGRASVKVFDAEGKQLMSMGGSGSYGPDEWSNQNRLGRRFGAQGANAPGEPTKLVWDVPREFEALPATFTFTNIPLQ
jgi:hypothetical protein